MPVPRRNRVDPFGDLHSSAARGLFTGNRGCLVDHQGHLARHHQGDRWITCVTAFRDRKHPLAAPRRWTPLFFLDDAVALAAGHRPCAECRPDDYRSYRDAVDRALGSTARSSAATLNRRLADERLGPGSGIERRDHRRLWPASFDGLPDGTVVVDDADVARLVVGDHTLAFAPTGWTAPEPRAWATRARILTPPTSVAALRHGFVPVLHPTGFLTG